MARRRRRYQRIPLQPASSGGSGSSSTSTSSTSSINSSGSTGSTCNAGNSAGSGMSSGKRLAKRSIIGTRVCAPGDDGKYYSGVISAVNTPTSPQQPELNGLTITPNTRYSVRFDPVALGSPPSSRTEFYDQDLIGPGFGSVTGARLVAGQKVYLTHNGREIHAEVIHHHEEEEEVLVAFKPSGHEELVNLTKRIEELRLLESRKSARLAEFDTDFARLADMGSDRKRASSHSIDMPQIVGTRKRRPSTSSESWAHTARSEGCMDECAAAMVLMSLSTPPKTNYQDSYGYWDMHNGSTRATVSSPGAGTSSGSSSASWRTGTPSPQFSDEGPCTSWAHSNNMGNHTITSGEYISNNPNHINDNMVNHTHHLNQMNQAHNQRFYPYPQRGSSSSSPNFSPFDEGIVPDIDLYRPRKKKTRSRIETEDNSSPWDSSSDDDDEDNDRKIYRCTWRYEDNRICTERSVQWSTIAAHVLNTHLKGKKTHDHEEDFYIVDELIEPTCSPPTKSHWDMVRPRTEDPEYQRQLLAAIPQLENLQLPTHVEGQDAVINQPYAMADVAGPSRATGSRQTTNPYDNNGEGPNATVTRMPGTRRVRGDTKKCRKIYGMENRDLWCTQCKWKKACSRFSD